MKGQAEYYLQAEDCRIYDWKSCCLSFRVRHGSDLLTYGFVVLRALVQVLGIVSFRSNLWSGILELRSDLEYLFQVGFRVG